MSVTCKIKVEFDIILLFSFVNIRQNTDGPRLMGPRGCLGEGPRVGKGSEEESGWRQLEGEEVEVGRFCSGPRASSPPHSPSSAARSRTGRS